MPFFLSEDIEIAYETYGEGKPVVLVHGFASNGRVNWVNTGWTMTLVEAGYQAITLDNRGHGQSQKIHDPAYYPARSMARDVVNLIAHLGYSQAALIGYSMGARISAFAALDAPEMVAAAVFGGLGINMVHGMADSEDIIAALEAPSLREVRHRIGRQFRIFADSTQSDLAALAACMRSSRAAISEADIGRIAVPALVAVGDEDTVGGPAQPLADLLPKGEALIIKGRDHMRATGDRQFKQGTLAFLERVYRTGR